MSEQSSLDDILSDAPVVPVAPLEPPAADSPQAPASEAAPETPPERPKSLRKQHRDREEAARAEGDGKVRDPESGQFVAKTPEEPPPEPAKAETKPAEPPPQQDMTPKERALLAAAADERRKRQELEQRLAVLEKPKEEPKAFWDDPENAMKTFEKKLEDVAINTRFNTAELIARSKYQDFEEKLNVFGELLKQTPGLHQQWVNAQDPAEFAYNIGKNHLQIQQVGSIDALLKKREEEVAARVRAELEAEYKTKAEEAQRARAALPPSLSEARGTAVNRTVWNGPTSLDDILKG